MRQQPSTSPRVIHRSGSGFCSALNYSKQVRNFQTNGECVPRQGGVVDEEADDDVGDDVVGSLLALLSHSTAIWCPEATQAPAEAPLSVMCRIGPSSN